MNLKNIQIYKTNKYFFVKTDDNYVKFKHKEIFSPIVESYITEDNINIHSYIKKHSSLKTIINEKITCLVSNSNWKNFLELVNTLEPLKIDNEKVNLINSIYTDNMNSIHEEVATKIISFVKKYKIKDKPIKVTYDIIRKEFDITKDSAKKIIKYIKQAGYNIIVEE